MANNPEDTFREKVNMYLPPHVYHEKTHNPFRRGIPDEYYESYRGILWLEYKWIPRKPKRKHTLDLTTLQLDWLNRAKQNNIPCGVCLGMKDGKDTVGIMIWEKWDEPITGFQSINLATPQQIAFHIAEAISRVNE